MHASPSLHAVPFALLLGAEQAPLDGSQVPALVHAEAPAQTTGVPLVQEPETHRSTSVQAFPSLHAVPFAAGAVRQPCTGSHPAAT